MKIYIQEEFVNATRHYRCEDSGVFESRFETKSEVYKFYSKEYGRCIGKVYVGDRIEIGWIFQKLVKYEDCNEKYLQEVWVTLHKNKPTKTIKYEYLSEKENG